MAHCCPACKQAAPLLFRFCPECGFDMKDCIGKGCTHTPSTMGEKYLIEHNECIACGGTRKTCDCYTNRSETIPVGMTKNKECFWCSNKPIGIYSNNLICQSCYDSIKIQCDWPGCFENGTELEDNSKYCINHLELNR